MIKTSYYVKIVYPDGLGGLEIFNAGPQKIIAVIESNDMYQLQRSNGNVITVPVSWCMVERIVEDAPEEVGNTHTGSGV